MIRRAGWIALGSGAGAAVLAPALAWIVSTVWGRDVRILSPAYDESIVEINRLDWSPGKPVAALYGTPSNETIRVVFADRSKLVVPREDPSLVLLKVDKHKGENPLQARTLRFFATWTAIAGLAAAAGGGGALLWAKRTARG